MVMKVLYGIEFEFYLNYEKICLNIVLMKVRYCEIWIWIEI